MEKSITGRTYSKSSSRGFTLIELLVTIAIIGVLSSVALGALQTARTRGEYASAQTQLRQLRQSMIVAQGESGRTLRQITGSNCSDCGVCRSADMRNVATSNTCYIAWINVITRIQQNNTSISGLDKFLRDPWGSPWMLDENEGEVGCQSDTLRTVGKDGLYNTADDYILTIPFVSQACA
jgi:prepilin-type N-terminal cleavage/methylation domain-containing protein